MPHVVVELDADGLANAKLSDERWELNVRAGVTEFLALRDIRAMDWNLRMAAKVGHAAGSDVFWSCDGEEATIMVGNDDETWDLAVSVPVRVVDELVRQVAGL